MAGLHHCYKLFYVFLWDEKWDLSLRYWKMYNLPRWSSPELSFAGSVTNGQQWI